MFVKFFTCDSSGLAVDKVMIRINDIQHLNPLVNISYMSPTPITQSDTRHIGYMSGEEIRTPVPGATQITMKSGLQWWVLMDFDEISGYLNSNEREDVE